MWKLHNFALTLFSKKIRENNVFTNEITEVLIWGNIFGESEFFIFPHCEKFLSPPNADRHNDDKKREPIAAANEI